MGLNFPAKRIVCTGNGQPCTHGHIPADISQQIRIPGTKGRLGGIGSAEPIFAYEFKGAPGQFKALLKRVVGITHAAHGDYPGSSLAAQLAFQHLKRILFWTDDVKVVNPIAGRMGITIDAAMTAAAVNVHVPVGVKELIRPSVNRRQKMLCVQGNHNDHHPFPSILQVMERNVNKYTKKCSLDVSAVHDV